MCGSCFPWIHSPSRQLHFWRFCLFVFKEQQTWSPKQRFTLTFATFDWGQFLHSSDLFPKWLNENRHPPSITQVLWPCLLATCTDGMAHEGPDLAKANSLTHWAQLDLELRYRARYGCARGHIKHCCKVGKINSRLHWCWAGEEPCFNFAIEISLFSSRNL